MSRVTYTESGFILAARVTDAPKSPYVSGYGGKVPTRYLATCSDGRERRVYSMQYGNSGSAFVRIGGADVFLSIEAESICEEAGRAAA